MGDLINLRQARKARVRDEKGKAAAANRQAFGRTKAERQTAALIQAAADRQPDGALRDREAGQDPGLA